MSTLKGKKIKAVTAYNDMSMIKNYLTVIDQSTIDEAERLIASMKKFINECLIKYEEGEEV